MSGPSRRHAGAPVGAVISPAELVERALAVTGPEVAGRVVLVTEASEAVLRWANNTMTTNGHSTALTWSVISMVALDGGVAAGVVTASAQVSDPAEIESAVRASELAARQAGPARDVAELIEPGAHTDVEEWDEPAAETSIDAYAELGAQLAEAFGRAGASKRVLYGFASHEVATTWLGTSTGVRRRWTQPTGSVELNAKSADLARSAWAGRSLPTPADFAELDLLALDAELSARLEWGRRRIELPPGRYATILPPSAGADLLTYLSWGMSGRAAQEGRSAFSAPPGSGSPTRVGERLTDLPLTLTSDPGMGGGLGTTPFLATTHSTDDVSVFDNGAPLGRVEWISDGVIGALAYTRAGAREFGADPTARFAPPGDNLELSGGPHGSLDDLVAGTQRGLLLTCLWYIRMVDPATLLLTGLTRDGVYLVEAGEVVGEVNNFRFNESPLDLLRRAGRVGVPDRALPREFKDWFTRARIPGIVVEDFNMSSVSQAS